MTLFCNEQPEQFAHGLSFVKRDLIESLMLLFKKELLSKLRRELFTLGNKNGEKLSKKYKI